MVRQQSPLRAAKEEERDDDGGLLMNGDADLEDVSDPPSPGAEDSQQDSKSAVPLQKRRRVTRACDECRKKKIKCDGKQPCTHCTVYSYDCTYDQPSNRRRNPVPAYVEALEARVQRAEGLIQMIAPNLDLNDPALDIAVRHGYIPGLRSSLPNAPPDASIHTAAPKDGREPDPGLGRDKSEADLESMIRAVSEFELDEHGHWDYHGHSSGLSFIRRMRERLGEIMGPDTGSTPFIKNRTVSSILDSPRSNSVESPSDGNGLAADLPSEELAREICGHAINMLSVLLRPIHIPSFWRSFERIFSQPHDQYNTEDHTFLPLLYSVLSVGSIYAPLDAPSYESAIDKGFKYFRAARQLIDLADIRDITSLQAVVFLILFLQSSAKLSQCYSYLGVAFRGAIRMGLHRSLPGKSFNPLEAEVRKRVFWSIRSLDIYVGALLGLPQSLTDEDIDQDQPLDVEDDLITETGIQTMPPGSVTLMTAFNKSTQLIFILSKIVKNIYPIRPKHEIHGPNKSYSVPFSIIREIENDLETWRASLPKEFDPAYNDPKFRRAQAALRLTYAFNQMLLYRPFLHFVGAEKRAAQTDQRAYACAATYINVSRNLIHLFHKTQKDGQISGAWWFIMYINFFAILSLVYFAAENPDNPTTQELMKDALKGREIISSMSKSIMAADRCASTLEAVFNKLPVWMREGRSNPQPKRKRKQNDVKQPSHPQTANIPRSVPSQVALDAMTSSPAAMPMLGSSGALGLDRSMTPQDSIGSGTYTPNGYSPTTQTMQQFGLQPPRSDAGQEDMPDFSSMLFSPAEPFNYPSQPLTAFEQHRRQHDGNNAPNTSDMVYGTAGGVSVQQQSGIKQAADSLEAQLYNIPPFMMQGGGWTNDGQAGFDGNGSSLNPQARTAAAQQQAQQQYILAQQQQQQHQQHQPHGASMGQGQQWQHPQQHRQQQQQQQPQQVPTGLGSGPSMIYADQGFGDMNLNDIFGGAEWTTPLMSQGYGR